MSTSNEESYNITLKLNHTDGVIHSARILKARSKLPDDIMNKINALFSDTFEPVKTETKTTVALGNIGEQMILAHLNTISKYNTDFIVEDTSSYKDHGDIAVEYKGNKICIEVKNYTKPIPGKEIDKYHRSLALPDYNIGLMISINDHGFAREYKIRSPIDIKIINGKPTAYLSGIDSEIIYPTISLLMSMTKDYSDTNGIQLELDNKIKALIDIHDRTKEMKTIIESQKKSLSKLEAMLNEIQSISLT